MAILDTRIDDRLIHGQVCGYWIPQYSLQRIAIVDDDIVNDETRKTTLKFGMPENCKLSIFGSAKAADKFIRKIDEGIKVMILCNSPVPILRMAEAGYQVPYITIGNMSNRPGATQIDKITFITPEEKEAFSKLVQKGVELYIQNTPRDVKRDVTELLK